MPNRRGFFGSLWFALAGLTTAGARAHSQQVPGPRVLGSDRARAITGLRLLNTAQAAARRERGRFLSRPELCQYPPFLQLAGQLNESFTDLAVDVNGFSAAGGLLVGFMPAEEWTADDDYEIVVRSASDEIAFKTDSTGVIRERTSGFGRHEGRAPFQGLPIGSVARSDRPPRGVLLVALDALAGFFMPVVHASDCYGEPGYDCCVNSWFCNGECQGPGACSCVPGTVCCNLGYECCTWCCRVGDTIADCGGCWWAC